MVAQGIEQGVITRIYLKNFVTYDEVTVRPGRNLNLIIGANGTGKSTIVSAIVLGLGGNPKVIGRATHVGDYVKAGQTNAIIEIDLQNDKKKSVTVRRSFDVQSHSTWTVNNTNVNAKKITELMQSFNIQVDNLCQFLPQDKVQEFSNLSPPDLLIETERSVGDPKLLEYHNKLKELRTSQAELEIVLQRSTRLHAKDKQTYDSLKDSVGHINEQKKIKKTLQTLKQKRAWILYTNKHDEFKQAKIGRDKAQAKKNKIEKKIAPVKEEISKLKLSVQTLEKTAKQHQSETVAKRSKLNKFTDEIEKYEKSVSEIESQCELEIRTERECDERINKLMLDKNKVENDLTHILNEVGPAENIEKELDTINLEMNEQRKILNELKSGQDHYKVQIDHYNRKIRGDEHNLQEVLNIENKRLNLLQKLSSDAHKGVTWLRANRHLFSKPIHEPMLLHINLKNPSYSKYFENIIPLRDLTAFVCEDKNDMNLLVRYLRDQQKLKINAVHSDPDREVNTQPVIPLDNIKQYGFQDYLVSLLEAPRTILNYLVTMYRIQDIPIGSDKVASYLEQIPNQLFRFFSTSNAYSVNHSKYTGEKSTRQAKIMSRDLLSITIDANRMQKIQDEINLSKRKINAFNDELKSIEEKIVDVNRKIETHKANRNKLQSNKSKIDHLKTRINLISETIKKDQQNRRSVDDIRAHFKKQIQDIIKRQLQVYKQYNNMVDECYKSHIIDEEMKLQIKLKKNEVAIKENDSQDLIAELQEAERNLRALENELNPLKLDVKNLFDQAKESTGGLNYNDPEFAPIKTAFAKLPATIEEIIEAIQVNQAKIFCLNNDQSEANRILEQFNTVKKNIESLQNIIKEKDDQLAKVTEDITRIKDLWHPMLTSLVEQINSNFSNYFAKMKCAGEVSLTTGENPMDFEKYGLKIKVKFRDADELQALTRNHQSGGERAVTTAVYMIALQELTRVPFRCVDEINQGMDATNERRVFELIVDITSKCNSSQYFLLTPKLLPNLKYNDTITVLTVFNGKFMVPCSKLDINENFTHIIETIRKRQVTVQ